MLCLSWDILLLPYVYFYNVLSPEINTFYIEQKKKNKFKKRPNNICKFKFKLKKNGFLT